MNNVEDWEYIHLAVTNMFLSKGGSNRILTCYTTNVTRTSKHLAYATRTAFRRQNALNCQMFSVHGFLLIMTPNISQSFINDVKFKFYITK